MLPRIFWIITFAVAFSLARSARADYDIVPDISLPDTDIPPAPDNSLQPANSDVIMATVLGDEEDPFAS